MLLILEIFLILNGVYASFRLPHDVHPNHYSLKLYPHMDSSSFSGEVTITVYSNSNKKSFILHSSNLTITKSLINQRPAKVKFIEDEQIEVYFEEEDLQPGEHLVYMEFHGQMQDKFGLRRINDEELMVVNEFEPTGARRAFPCFDEPSFKARFSVKLVAPNNSYRAISNMPEIDHYPTPEGVLYIFQTSVKMSTYLLSFAITDFPYYGDVLEINNRSIPIRVYCANASKENNGLVVRSAKKAIEWYTNYTGIEYPLPKLDMIECDKEVAATETWGLIQFRKGLLSENLDYYSEFQMKLVVFHEYGHYWFGNLVTNDWWNDLWLQEGLASFMSYKILEEEEKHSTDSHLSISNILFEIRYEEMLSIVEYLNSAKDIENRFNSIIYKKSLFIIKWIESVIGKIPFQKAIQNYLKKYAYKTATTNDLITELEAVVFGKIYLRSYLESFIYQPGYPLISLEEEEESYLVRQSSDNGSQRWTIPISYKMANNASGFLWFDKDINEARLAKGNNTEWTLFNTAEKPGLYLVDYSEKMWTNIFNNLKTLPDGDVTFLAQNVGLLYHMKHINCDILFRFVQNAQKRSLALSSIFTAMVEVLEDVVCVAPKTLLEEMGKYYKEIQQFIELSCDPTSLKNTDQRNLECVKWIEKNFIEIPNNSV